MDARRTKALGHREPQRASLRKENRGTCPTTLLPPPERLPHQTSGPPPPSERSRPVRNESAWERRHFRPGVRLRIDWSGPEDLHIGRGLSEQAKGGACEENKGLRKTLLHFNPACLLMIHSIPAAKNMAMKIGQASAKLRRLRTTGKSSAKLGFQSACICEMGKN